MKFSSIIKRFDDTKSALVDAQWRYERAVDHLKKVKASKPQQPSMDKIALLGQKALEQQESIEFLEKKLKDHTHDMELADYRIREIDPIIDELSP